LKRKQETKFSPVCDAKGRFPLFNRRHAIDLQGNSEARAMLAPQTSPELDYRHEINELRLRTV